MIILENVIKELINRSLMESSSLVVLMCGIAGSGKTTVAQALEKEGFIRLSIDEEIWKTNGRYGIDYRPELYEPFQKESREKQWRELPKLIQNKKHIVIDYSFWQRDQREQYMKLVEENGGFWKLIYIKMDEAELRKRLNKRSSRFDANAAFPITEDILRKYFDGFEEPQGEGEIIIIQK